MVSSAPELVRRPVRDIKTHIELIIPDIQMQKVEWTTFCFCNMRQICQAIDTDSFDRELMEASKM